MLPLPPGDPERRPGPRCRRALMRLTCAVAGSAGLRIGVGPCADKPRVVLLNDVAATWTLLPEERELVDAQHAGSKLGSRCC